MLFATFFGLLLIPVFYVVVRRLLGDKLDEVSHKMPHHDPDGDDDDGHGKHDGGTPGGGDSHGGGAGGASGQSPAGEGSPA
jgi:multidrug efflux pump